MASNSSITSSLTFGVIETSEHFATVIETSGIQGPQGAPGSSGQPGPAGPPGPPGTSTSNASEIAIEAGENLLLGAPVYINNNKAYSATYTTNPTIIGLIKQNINVGLAATIVTSGSFNMPNLISGAIYFLGNNIITNVSPNSGYVIRLGNAINDNTLMINIEEPILLT